MSHGSKIANTRQGTDTVHRRNPTPSHPAAAPTTRLALTARQEALTRLWRNLDAIALVADGEAAGFGVLQVLCRILTRKNWRVRFLPFIHLIMPAGLMQHMPSTRARALHFALGVLRFSIGVEMRKRLTLIEMEDDRAARRRSAS